MKTIVNGNRSSVLFDEAEDIFIKNFTPNLKARIKYFFRFRKYPGYNFAYIAKILNKFNINTPEIVAVSKYSVTTKNIHGISLYECYNDNPILINKYVQLITFFLKNNIYSGDLSLDNFIVKNNEIFVIDLEDYRYTHFFSRTTKEALRRLKGKIPDEIFNKIKINFK